MLAGKNIRFHVLMTVKAECGNRLFCKERFVVRLVGIMTEYTFTLFKWFVTKLSL